MFGMPDEKGTPEPVMLSLSPFGQNADHAKTIDATYCANPMIKYLRNTHAIIFSAAMHHPTLHQHA